MMRHRKDGRRLGRNTSHRKALLKNLAIALILNERIRTTVARGKELRRLGDRLATLAKRGDLHARRMAASHLNSKEATKKLFETIGPRFQGRPGGYTRLIKAGYRPGDNASMCFIEYLPQEGGETKEKAKGGRKKGEE